MNKRSYLRLWLQAMERYEIGLRVSMALERNRFIKESAKRYESEGAAINASSLKIHRDAVQARLYKHYKEVANVFARMQRSQIKSANARETKAASIFEQRMLEWIATQALAKSKMIVETNMDDITSAISKGVAEGEGVESIARMIRAKRDITPSRAATIARTETHAAANYGAIESSRALQEETGVKLVKEWLPTNDGRTRPEHLAMAGKVIEMGEQFAVPSSEGGVDYMDRPGDSSASAANLINCRCGLITYEP
jgi:uncharacterized protein with gpF-like domain